MVTLLSSSNRYTGSIGGSAMQRHKRHARLERALPAPASTEDYQDGESYPRPLRNLICNATYGVADYTLVYQHTRWSIFIQRIRAHHRPVTRHSAMVLRDRLSLTLRHRLQSP